MAGKILADAVLDCFAIIRTLEKRGVVTIDPEKAEECCGLPRDSDGFCSYKPRHPIFVRVL